MVPIYGVVWECKGNRKLSTFLNDAVDLRLHRMKKEIQQLKVCYTSILECVNQSYVIKRTLKK